MQAVRARLRGYIEENFIMGARATPLGDGESSRLHKKLVKDLGWAQDASASTEDHRGPDAFVVDAHLSEKQMAKAGGLDESSRLEVGGDLHDLVVDSAEARSLVLDRLPTGRTTKGVA